MRIRAATLAVAALGSAALVVPATAAVQYYRDEAEGSAVFYGAAPAPDDTGDLYAGGYGRGAYPPPAYRGPAAYYRGARPLPPEAPYREGGRRCDRGDGGTLIGAIAGGLLGNTMAGRGDRMLGTVLGAGAGALAGRAVDRDC